MFPQHIDLEFFYDRAWAGRLKDVPGRPKQVPTIDDVIEAHARVRWSANHIAANNLLSIVRSVRRRGESIEAKLAELALNPGTIYEANKRRALARRWLRKMSET